MGAGSYLACTTPLMNANTDVLSVCMCVLTVEIVMERDSFLVKALERASQQHQDQEQMVSCPGLQALVHKTHSCHAAE